MARSRPTVLVVDDDDATRDGLITLLESWGYTASAAADGKDALKHCEEALPHAIVTDLMMPGMNGLEFVGALGERAQEIAIIFVTGQATIDTAVQAIKLGAYDYLPKPLEPHALSRCARKGAEADRPGARGGRAAPTARVAARVLRRLDRQVRAHAPTLPADRPDRRDRRGSVGQR